MFRHLLWSLAYTAVAVVIPARPVAAQPVADPPTKVVRVKAVVPDGMSRLSDTITGSYFVAAPLKQKYDELLARLDALKRDIDADRIAGPDAVKRSAELRVGLRELREQLDKSRVMIPAVQAHSRVETVSFDIGPERTVVISADRVRVVGTDGDKIVCTLEKVYLGGDAKEAEAELAAIKVVHRHGPQLGTVGKSPAESDAAEAAFLRTPDGLKLTPEERAERLKWTQEIRTGQEEYRDFQGKNIDVLEIGGMDSKDNAQLVITAISKGGDGSVRSVRRRHGTLTVAVPKCKHLAVLGARAGLEIAGVQGSLLVTNQNNRERDYEAQFAIKGVRGDVTVVGFPLTRVEDVTGGVTVTALEDFANSGGRYDESGWGRTRSRAVPCLIKNVGGDLRARLGRVDLQVEDVRGAIAIDNETGDTKVTVAAALATKAAHRLTTVSGTIDVNFGPGTLGKLPLIVATDYGSYRTNIPQGECMTFIFGGGGRVPRGLQGFHRVDRTVKESSHIDSFAILDQLKPEDKSPGLVIRTLAGHIVVTVADK